MPEMNRTRVAFVGDPAVGKTSCLMTYENGGCFPKGYDPDPLTARVYKFNKFIDRDHEMLAYDIIGADGYDFLRQMIYDRCDMIVLFYSVAMGSTFENILHKWLPEIRSGNGRRRDLPILLVASSIDKRRHRQKFRPFGGRPQVFITESQGHKMARRINAVGYAEISSATAYGVEHLFNKLFKMAYDKHRSLLIPPQYDMLSSSSSDDDSTQANGWWRQKPKPFIV